MNPIWDDYQKRAEYEMEHGLILHTLQERDLDDFKKTPHYKGASFSPMPFTEYNKPTLLREQQGVPTAGDVITIEKYGYLTTWEEETRKKKEREELAFHDFERMVERRRQKREEALKWEKVRKKGMLLRELEKDFNEKKISWVYYQWKRACLSCF